MVPDDYPYHLAHDWAPGYRARRITDLLAVDDRVSLDAMQSIQAQTYSLPAEALRPNLLAVEPENELQRRAPSPQRQLVDHAAQQPVPANISGM